jgi:hypothetical protein
MIGLVLDLLQHFDALDTHVRLTSKETVFLFSWMNPECSQNRQLPWCKQETIISKVLILLPISKRVLSRSVISNRADTETLELGKEQRRMTGHYLIIPHKRILPTLFWTDTFQSKEDFSNKRNLMIKMIKSSEKWRWKTKINQLLLTKSTSQTTGPPIILKRVSSAMVNTPVNSTQASFN